MFGDVQPIPAPADCCAPLLSHQALGPTFVSTYGINSAAVEVLDGSAPGPGSADMNAPTPPTVSYPPEVQEGREGMAGVQAPAPPSVSYPPEVPEGRGGMADMKAPTPPSVSYGTRRNDGAEGWAPAASRSPRPFFAF